jgi:hypothetical protein
MLYFIIISVLLLLILECVDDNGKNTVGLDGGHNFFKSCVDPECLVIGSIIVCVDISVEIPAHTMPVLHVHCPTQYKYSVVLFHPVQTMRKQTLTSLIMSRFTIENNNADVLKGKDYVHHNGVGDEDNVFMDESFFDEYGRFD